VQTPADNEAASREFPERHIANLEAQCAALQGEILSLRSRVDPTIAVVPPERSSGGAGLLEVFWKSAGQEFAAERSFHCYIPQGGLVSTRYLEIPPDASGHIRLDPGNQPGLWIIWQIAIHHVDEQGGLMQPPAAMWDPQNQFAGIIPANQAIILPGPETGGRAAFKVLNWNSDPQLLLPLPANPQGQARIVSISAAALDLAHAIMAQQGELLVREIMLLQAQLKG
jgi:hypothetical protein